MTTYNEKRKPRISRAGARLMRVEQRAIDRRLDDALCETFPASDPIAIAVQIPVRLRHG